MYKKLKSPTPSIGSGQALSQKARQGWGTRSSNTPREMLRGKASFDCAVMRFAHHGFAQDDRSG